MRFLIYNLNFEVVDTIDDVRDFRHLCSILFKAGLVHQFGRSMLRMNGTEIHDAQFVDMDTKEIFYATNVLF